MTRSAGDLTGSGLITVQIFVFRDNPLKYTDPDGKSDITSSLSNLFVSGGGATVALSGASLFDLIIPAVAILGLTSFKPLTNDELKVMEQNHTQNQAISELNNIISESRSSAKQKGAFGSPGVGIGKGNIFNYQPPERPNKGQVLAASILNFFSSQSSDELQDVLKGGVIGAVNAALGTNFESNGVTQNFFETIAYFFIQKELDK
jgi:hypothetical protein